MATVNKKSDVLIIIPAYNEAENIENIVDEITTGYPQYDYVVVNDGSSDATSRILKKRGYNHINCPINLGIGGAIQTGYRYAREKDYEIAVQIDGDGQHDPAYIKDIITPIREGEADYVIGSRFVNKEGFQSSATRRIGIKFLSGLITVLCLRRVKDVTSGFRAVNKFFIDVFSENYPIDYPEPEAILDAVMRRKRILELPVIMRERETGKSSINFRRSIYYMIKVTLDIIVCRISYGIRR
ncbi:glycosyltransferase family 2 protein [Butyrivibrio sp. INlla16]|uniref:glycosyltransferase family 2 protein n=1 Tax=Butyrivibrio sp. INlla16 TaxID=1520807 RepID=UPI00088E80B2|nr:glycosyltransferase family 2 protein [Butyrivibrio sp. INlla16]SDB18930.1 Glycosyltransferase involved in cell wall bisynthesis [Butyrivibrio sp. INlla16]